MKIESLPIEPEQVSTVDASDLATAITLVNDIKSKLNTLITDFAVPLLGELNQSVKTTNIQEVVDNG